LAPPFGPASHRCTVYLLAVCQDHAVFTVMTLSRCNVA
jgi:hypothetical protein